MQPEGVRLRHKSYMFAAPEFPLDAKACKINPQSRVGRAAEGVAVSPFSRDHRQRDEQDEMGACGPTRSTGGTQGDGRSQRPAWG